MHCHCGTNNRAPRWTFTDPCKPEVRPGAREESASSAWLAAPAMNKFNINIDAVPMTEVDVVLTLHTKRAFHSSIQPFLSYRNLRLEQLYLVL